MPVVLLALVVGGFVASGSSLVGLIGANPPQPDEFDVRRVEFQPGEIRVRVTNPQQDDLTIASVTVDDAIVPFELDGAATLGRLRSSTIVIPYRWVEDDPITIGVTSSTGIETVEEIPAAVETPGLTATACSATRSSACSSACCPVALGLLWLPSLRRVDQRWLTAFMALTAGLPRLPRRRGALRGLRAPGGGAGRVRRPRARAARRRAQLPVDDLPLDALLGAAAGALGGVALATLVAIGIGVHNFGEGLAIGTSFAFGQLTLGSFLIVGFMVHNVTEGLGIAAPAADEGAQLSWRRLAALALIAGGPAIFGAWTGGFVANDVLAVLFFGAAAGAAFEVVAEVVRYVLRRRSGRDPLRLRDRRLPRGHRRHVRHGPDRRLTGQGSRMGRTALGTLALALLLAGCGPIEPPRARVLAGETIRVVTTIGMITDAVEHVGGDRVEVEGLMGPGIDPHLYKASEGDVRRLDEADIIFYNGLHLEGKMADVLRADGRAARNACRSPTRFRASELLTPAEFEGTVRPARLVRCLALDAGGRTGAATRWSRLDPGPCRRAYRRERRTRTWHELTALDAYVHEQARTIPAKRSGCSSPPTTRSATSAARTASRCAACRASAPRPRRAPATCRSWPTSSSRTQIPAIFVEIVGPAAHDRGGAARRSAARGFDVADRRLALLRRDGRPRHAGGHLHRHGAAQHRHDRRARSRQTDETDE